MKRGISRYSTLFIFVGITAIGFVLGLGALLFMWLMIRLAGVDTSFWAMTEALATMVAAAAVLGGGFVAYRELSEISSSRHMEVANQLFEELNAPENVAARRWIFRNLPESPAEGMGVISPEGRDAMKKVLNSLDHVAFLTQAGWIPEDLVMPWMEPMITKAWIKLEPYVLFERERRKEPGYYAYANRLAERCGEWRSKNRPDAPFPVWVDDAL